MRTVKLAYSNMWGHAWAFDGDYMLQCFPCLRGHYEFVISKDPELVFFSVYNYVSDRFEGAKRLLYVGEPGDHFGCGAKLAPGKWEPGFYHYGITCSANERSQNHCYMPQGLLHLNLYNDGVKSLVRDESSKFQVPSSKEYFANFIYSNGNSRYRVDFFHQLQKHRRIESCGHVERNNNALASAAYSKEGYLLKQAFQRRCKFSIAMENTVFAGYTSEKLTDPLVAGSLPIYWGDPTVDRFFNPDAFIDVSRFKNDEEAIDWILKVDGDDTLYQGYLNAPPFRGNAIPEELSDEHYLKFFQKVLGD